MNEQDISKAVEAVLGQMNALGQNDDVLRPANFSN